MVLEVRARVDASMLDLELMLEEALGALDRLEATMGGGFATPEQQAARRRARTLLEAYDLRPSTAPKLWTDRT